MGGGRSNAPPPPAGGGKSRGPAGRGLMECVALTSQTGNYAPRVFSPSRLRLQRHDCVDVGHVLLAFQHFHPMSCTLGEGNARTVTIHSRMGSTTLPQSKHNDKCRPYNRLAAGWWRT